MSNKKAHDEVRDNVIRELDSLLGQELEKIHGRSIYSVGKLSFYMKATITPTQYSSSKRYLFGISYHPFAAYVSGDGYLLLLRGYIDGMPEKLYLIPKTFFYEFRGYDFSMEERTQIFKLNLVIDSDGKEWINKDPQKRDLRQYWLSVEDIARVLLPGDTSDKSARITKSIPRTDNDLARTYGVDPRRDSAKVRNLKSLYGKKCQICGGLYIGNNEYYSEVHHIWPIGQGGSDEQDNMLVVCPNHHIEFEYGCLKVASDGESFGLSHIDSKNSFNGSSLHVESGHDLGAENLRYHEANIWRGGHTD